MKQGVQNPKLDIQEGEREEKTRPISRPPLLSDASQSSSAIATSITTIAPPPSYPSPACRSSSSRHHVSVASTDGCARWWMRPFDRLIRDINEVINQVLELAALSATEKEPHPGKEDETKRRMCRADEGGGHG